MLNHIQNFPTSFFITARLDTHGQYNSENTKNDTALAMLKCTTLVYVVKLAINAPIDVTLLLIEKVESNNSFAMTPTINEQTIPALSNPIGANKNEILSAKKNKILSVIVEV